MGKVNLISQAEYSRHRNVSEAAVSNAIKAGRISLIEGRIDPVAADAQWQRNSRVRAKSPRPPGVAPAGTANGSTPTGPLSASLDDLGVGRSARLGDQPGEDGYWQSRSRREWAEAEMAEIELAEKNGQIIQVKAVETVWASSLASAREHLLQVRARLAPMLAAESDPYKIDQLLDIEHSQALLLLSGARLTP